jgi:hypothetical protein
MPYLFIPHILPYFYFVGVLYIIPCGWQWTTENDNVICDPVSDTLKQE